MRRGQRLFRRRHRFKVIRLIRNSFHPRNVRLPGCLCVLVTCVSCCGGVARMATVLFSLVKNLSDRCPRPDLLAHSRTIRRQAWICSTLERWNQPRDGPARDTHTCGFQAGFVFYCTHPSVNTHSSFFFFSPPSP